MRITASDIKGLLSCKHSKDIFVPECKNGASGMGMRMMDAWAMKRSWAHPCYYGYEIKISRNDFLQDKKWHEYLDLCNEFSFVCPHGIIKPEELSNEVGLLVVAKTGTKLFTRKKAQHRILETPPVGLLEYILMARTRIVDSTYYAYLDESREQYWRNWLEDKESRLTLGTDCSRKLQRSFKEQVFEVESKMRVMQKQIDFYKEVKDLCEELGINQYRTWRVKETLQEQWDKVNSLLPPEFIDECEKLQNKLSSFLEFMNKQGS